MGEGQGEEQSLPNLASRLLSEHGGDDILYVDQNVMRVKDVHHLAKSNFKNWKRYLAAATKKRELGAILLVLDGDAGFFPAGTRTPFCPADVASQLTKVAEETVHSAERLAVVFACREYESWLIAGVSSIAGKQIDGRVMIPKNVEVTEPDLEAAPRDAKGWLSKRMPNGYSPTRDQAILTRAVNFDIVRDRKLRSFARLEHAVNQLIDACRNGDRALSPPPSHSD